MQCATHPKDVSSFELWIHARGVHQGPNTSTWHAQLSNNSQISMSVLLRSNSDMQQIQTGGKHFDKRFNKHEENETVELGLKNSGVLKLLANKLPTKGSMLAWRKSETYCVQDSKIYICIEKERLIPRLR